MTGVMNMNGSGTSDAIPQMGGSPMKVNYVPPPVYNVKGPELAQGGFENTNRPAKDVPKVEAILAERGKRYGSFKDHAHICQTLKITIEKCLEEYQDDAYHLAADQKQALDVICDKIARIINGDPNYVDNWDDIAGYATLVSKRLTNGN